jgi:hypothetical protein
MKRNKWIKGQFGYTRAPDNQIFLIYKYARRVNDNEKYQKAWPPLSDYLIEIQTIGLQRAEEVLLAMGLALKLSLCWNIMWMSFASMLFCF